MYMEMVANNQSANGTQQKVWTCWEPNWLMKSGSENMMMPRMMCSMRMRLKWVVTAMKEFLTLGLSTADLVLSMLMYTCNKINQLLIGQGASVKRQRAEVY
jgi:hypothetical protein